MLGKHEQVNNTAPSTNPPIDQVRFRFSLLTLFVVFITVTILVGLNVVPRTLTISSGIVTGRGFPFIYWRLDRNDKLISKGEAPSFVNSEGPSPVGMFLSNLLFAFVVIAIVVFLLKRVQRREDEDWIKRVDKSDKG